MSLNSISDSQPRSNALEFSGEMTVWCSVARVASSKDWLNDPTTVTAKLAGRIKKRHFCDSSLARTDLIRKSAAHASTISIQLSAYLAAREVILVGSG